MQNRRNLYRILHVQPEAPLEIIKASYRSLMTKLKLHPDLGGDHDAEGQCVVRGHGRAPGSGTAGAGRGILSAARGHEGGLRRPARRGQRRARR